MKKSPTREPQGAMETARQELVNYITENGVEMSVYVCKGDAYGTIEVETDNGWYFIQEEIPVDLVIDSYSSYSPATYWEPEDWSDVEGHIDSVEYQKQPFKCFPPSDKPFNEQESFELKVDTELAKLLDEKCNTDDIDIHDELIEMEKNYYDYQEGLRDKYYNNLRDELRDES